MPTIVKVSDEYFDPLIKLLGIHERFKKEAPMRLEVILEAGKPIIVRTETLISETHRPAPIPTSGEAQKETIDDVHAETAECTVNGFDKGSGAN